MKLLQIFCDAFDFNKNDCFQFRPDDKVMDIYSSLYTTSGPDSLEPNRLIEDLEKEFVVTFDNTNNRLEQIESFDQIIKEIKETQQKNSRYGVNAARDL